MMVLFYGEGRLGNQLFQYQALNALAGGRGRIIAVGLEELGALLEIDGVSVSVITRNLWLKRAVKYLLLPLLLRPLSRHLRLIGYGTETQGGPHELLGGGELRMRRGLLSYVAFVDGGHYQSARHLQPCFPLASLRLPAERRAAAQQFLDQAGRYPHGGLPAFVHVRRGDYLGYSAYGQTDLVLPEEYYRRAIAELRWRCGPLQLIFVTDDPGWVEDRFRDLPDKTVVSRTPSFDFALMAECRAGILSNSSFGLAAALLANPMLLIAPLYWLGFRATQWLPPELRIEDRRLLYLEVPAVDSAP